VSNAGKVQLETRYFTLVRINHHEQRRTHLHCRPAN